MKPYSKITVVLGLAIVMAVSSYIILRRPQNNLQYGGQSTAAGTSTSPAPPYRNERVGFSIDIPPGYRLALKYMRFLDETSGYPIRDWSATNTQEVVLTNVSTDREDTFVDSVSSSEVKPLEFNTITSFPDSIFISAVGGTLASAQMANAVLPQPEQIVFQKLTVSSAAALRFLNHSNEETVDIAFNASRTLSSGFPIGSIMIKMDNATNTFDETAFDEVVDSFRFEGL